MLLPQPHPNSQNPFGMSVTPLWRLQMPWIAGFWGFPTVLSGVTPGQALRTFPGSPELRIQYTYTYVKKSEHQSILNEMHVPPAFRGNFCCNRYEYTSVKCFGGLMNSSSVRIHIRKTNRREFKMYLFQRALYNRNVTIGAQDSFSTRITVESLYIARNVHSQE